MCDCRNKGLSCNGSSCQQSIPRPLAEQLAAGAAATSAHTTVNLARQAILRGVPPLDALQALESQAANAVHEISNRLRQPSVQAMITASARPPGHERSITVSNCGTPSTLAEHSCFRWPCADFPAVWFSSHPDTGRPCAQYNERGSDYSRLASLPAFGHVVQRLCGASEQIEIPFVSRTGDGTLSVTGGFNTPYLSDLGLLGIEIEFVVASKELLSSPSLIITIGAPVDSGWDVMPYEGRQLPIADATAPTVRGPIGRTISVDLNTSALRGSIFVPFAFRAVRGQDVARPVYSKIATYGSEEPGTGLISTNITGGTGNYSYRMRPITSESEALARCLDALESSVRID